MRNHVMHILESIVRMAPDRKSSGLKCNFTKKPKQYWSPSSDHNTSATWFCSPQMVAKTSHQSLLLHEETWGVRGCCQAPPPSSPCVSGRQLQPSCRKKQCVSQSCDASGPQTTSTLLLPPMWEHHGRPTTGQQHTILFISDWCADFFQIHSDTVIFNTRTHTGQKESSL